MPDMAPCPADVARGEIGGDRTCGQDFPTENGTIMHAINKEDAHHEIIDSQRAAYQNYQPQSDSEPDQSNPEPEPTAADGAGDVEAITPTMPAAEQDDDAEPDQDDQEMVECPNCGEPLGTRFELEQAIAEHGKVYCESCGYEVRQE